MRSPEAIDLSNNSESPLEIATYKLFSIVMSTAWRFKSRSSKSSPFVKRFVRARGGTRTRMFISDRGVKCEVRSARCDVRGVTCGVCNGHLRAQGEKDDGDADGLRLAVSG